MNRDEAAEKAAEILMMLADFTDKSTYAARALPNPDGQQYRDLASALTGSQPATVALPSQPTEDQKRVDIIHDLVYAWNALEYVEWNDEVDSEQMLIAQGLTALVFRTSSLACHFIEEGMPHEATPLIRLAYETALTSQWAAHSPKIVDAYVHYMRRQSRLQVEHHKAQLYLTPTHRPDKRELEQARAYLNRDKPRALSVTTERICRYFEDYDQHYLLYRLLSEQCHAGPDSFTPYVMVGLPDQTGALPTTIHRVPKQPAVDIPLLILITSLVWAGSAHDALTRDQPLAELLSEVSEMVGVREHLKLSNEGMRQLAEERAL